LYSKNLPVNTHGKILRSKPKVFRNYGVGDALVVVVSVVVDVPGVEVAAGLVVVVLVLSEVLEVPPAGVGFTTVVLFSVLFSGAGEVAGAAVSVRCSQAVRSAAPARMQMYFFIMLRIGWAHIGLKAESGQGEFSALRKSEFARRIFRALKSSVIPSASEETRDDAAPRLFHESLN
jgi:hypothetical protein